MKKRWTTDAMPDLSGRVAVVTGANGGLGVVTCRELAAAGAEVVMACRNLEKGQAVLEDIQRQEPTAKLALMALDLASLASIAAFAEAFNKAYGKLDLLINNAGLIGLPLRRTEDGFEMQMGVDCLGHFALTGQLLGSLRQSPGARVIAVGTSSQVHSLGRIKLTDLNWEKRRYNQLKATIQAKLALQVCTFELNQRLAEAGDNIIGVVVHPGVASTNISLAGPEMAGASIKKRMMQLFNSVFAQTAYMGALPTLYAAVADGVRGGDYYGPGGWFELRGYPAALAPGARALNRDFAARLWSHAEAMTGVRYLSSA